MQVSTNVAKNESGGALVTETLFGANTLFHLDTYEQDSELNKIVSSANISFLRYPGGTVTEEYFDLKNPNSIENENFIQVLDGNLSPNSRKITPLSDFLHYCDQVGMSPMIVIPTYRFFNQSTKTIYESAESEIKEFISSIINGKYGDVEIRGFEIGNEWYQDRFDWSTDEFGKLQSDIAKWIGEAIDGTGVEDTPLVYAQAGRTPEENALLAKYFYNDEVSSIEGVITHLYGTNSAGNSLGIGGGIGRRLEEISESWNVVAPDIDVIVTEWNVGENGEEKTLINGIMRTAPLLRIFVEMVSANVDLANIWTATAPGPAALGDEIGGAVALSPTGYLFQLLSQNLAGLQLFELESGNNLRGSNNSHVGYKYLFASEAESVVYFVSGVGYDLEVNSSISVNFTENTYVYATILGGAPGEDGLSYRSAASIELATDIDVEIDINGNLILSHELAPYELIQYHFVTGHGVSLLADQFIDIDDELRGSTYGDTIYGFGGADLLEGMSGNDIVDGGDGNDTIFSGSGSDRIFGGSGEDLLSYENMISAFSGSVLSGIVSHGYGTDTVSDVDEIKFTSSDDVIVSDNSISKISTGVGDDSLTLEIDHFVYYGSDAMISVDGGIGRDSLEISGSEEPVTFFLNEGSVEIAGGVVEFEGFEVLIGTSQNDRFSGLVKGIELSGGDGNDVFQVDLLDGIRVEGGGGDDFFHILSGIGTIFGGEGDDFVLAVNSSNAIYGGAGDDFLKGGSGDDRISGGSGNDTLTGGLGADVFILDASGGADIIRDFSHIDDTVEFAGMLPTDFQFQDTLQGAVAHYNDQSSIEFYHMNSATLMQLIEGII
jgi:hypothetical protein